MKNLEEKTMGKHDGDFKQGSEDMDKANEALENNQIGKSLYYTGRESLTQFLVWLKIK